MSNTPYRMRNMARKTEKGGKFRNVHCRTWNMTRKLKIMENEKHPLEDLKNDEIAEKRALPIYVKNFVLGKSDLF